DRTIGIQAKYPAGRHAIKLVETTINHKFAVVCTTIMNNGVNVTIATGAESVGSLVKPEGRIQGAVGMQPGQVPYFHAIHDDRIACFQSVGFIILPADVIAEAAAYYDLIPLRIHTAYVPIDAPVEPRVVFYRIRLVWPPEGANTHRVNGAV